MAKETWWVIAPESRFSFEQQANGDLVVTDTSAAEQHVLHGYEWMHVKHGDEGQHRIKVHGEGPPPFGQWVALDEG
ncbi:maltose regulon activator MalT [Rhodococcus sp. NPDC059234]|uniref:maltose regulon activator MalT n=1 Tax=Rhodococcus sp. NPDC059234 TaxID=3346781 RepID=UPI00367108B5